MYALPDDFDGSMLLSKELESVGFNQYQVCLFLEGGTLVQIEGEYQFHSGEITERRCLDDGVGPSHLPLLVGETISDLLIDRSNGDLVLSFKNGASLVIFGDVGPYEAYKIVSGGREIIV